MRRMFWIGLIAILVVAALASGAAARPSSAPMSGYSLDWYTIDGGGATFSTGGGYSLGGTIGQPDAGVLSSGSYTLVGGFWGGAAVNYNVYLPLILKNF
jgi:hypothetical protein